MFSRLERHEIDSPLLNIQEYQIFHSSLCSNFSNKNNTQNTDLVCNMHYAESISVGSRCVDKQRDLNASHAILKLKLKVSL